MVVCRQIELRRIDGQRKIVAAFNRQRPLAA
jgi:hypothetical protein